MKNCMIGMVATVVTAMSLGAFAANTYWVDDDNYGKSGDGSTAEKAFGTIQEGVEAAATGDTVIVKPGLYNQGGTNVTGYGHCRVYIRREITLKAESSNPADTIIMGAPDPDTAGVSNKWGAGPNAYRCIAISTLEKPIVKGFTITGGCPDTHETAREAAGNAAGVSATVGNMLNFYVTDCVISNNVGVRGGAVRYGNYVRCIFTDNRAISGQPIGRDIKLVHCLGYRQKSSNWLMAATAINTTLVNCKVSNTDSSVGNHDSTHLYNSIAPENKIVGSPAMNCSYTNSILRGYHPTIVSERPELYGGCVIDEPYALVAPLFDDYRTRADSKAENLGSSDYITKFFANAPAEVEVYKSLDGVTVPTSGANNICAGCYQRPVETLGGYWFVRNSQLSRSGTAGENILNEAIGYAFYPDATTVYTFKLAPAAGEYTFRLDGSNNRIGDLGKMRYPRVDDTFLLMAPPAGSVITNYMIFANTKYYVNDETGKDDGTYDGLSADKPFKTIQKAVDKSSANTPTIISVAAGVYDEGVTIGDYYRTRRVRVSLTESSMVRIVGAGRGQTIIKGAPDPNSPTGDGRGPNAVACVDCGDTYSCIQNLTICDGYSNTTNTLATAEGPDPSVTGDDAQYWAGLVAMRSADFRSQILDCDLTNGVAYYAGMVYNGVLVRCHLYNARAMGGALLQGSSLYNCLIDHLDTHFNTNNGSETSDPYIDRIGVPYLCYAYGCTFYNEKDDGFAAGYPMRGAYNVFYGAKNSRCRVNDDSIGNLFYGYELTFDPHGTTEGIAYKYTDPMFVNAASGDYRLATLSGGVGWMAYDPANFRRYVGDINGNAPYFDANGKFVIGAFGTPIDSVQVNGSDYATVSPAGRTVVEPGASVTITARDNGTRPFVGMVVDGKTIIGNPAEYTFTAGSVPGSPVTISMLISTNWYVNAVSGDDLNNGFTADTAWKHLAMLTNAYIMSGDRVHAAKGDYNEESVETKFTYSAIKDVVALSRVEVPTGVTLIADEGSDETFITGAKGTSSVSYDTGVGAIRCVTLRVNSRIEGFTLRDGHTLSSTAAGKNDGDQVCGGGVFSAPYNSSSGCGTVYNCVITNCTACRGGAVRGALTINCKLFDCIGTACGGVASHGWLVGCYIDHMTRGGNIQWFRESLRLSHCTLGPDFKSTAGINELQSSYGGIDNTVVLCDCTSLQTAANFYTNCVFKTLGASVSRDGLSADSVETDVADLHLENCRPTRQSVLLLDKGGTSLNKTAKYVTDARLEDRDAAMGQRVYNGAMDIGAFEFDWRPTYKADLGSGDFTVTTADPQVVEVAESDDKALLIRSGAVGVSIPGTDGSKDKHRCQFTAQVTGNGTLTVCTNGAEFATLTKAATATTFNLPRFPANVDNAVTFEYAKGDGDTDEYGAVIDEFDAVAPGIYLMLE